MWVRKVFPSKLLDLCPVRDSFEKLKPPNYAIFLFFPHMLSAFLTVEPVLKLDGKP